MPRDFLTFPMKEDRVRQYVGRGRIFWLLIDGCLSIFHFRRQASKNFIHEHDRCTTLLNDATGSASVLMLQLPSERLTMWKVSIRQSCSWQWSNRARSTYENIDDYFRTINFNSLWWFLRVCEFDICFLVSVTLRPFWRFERRGMVGSDMLHSQVRTGHWNRDCGGSLFWLWFLS